MIRNTSALAALVLLALSAVACAAPSGDDSDQAEAAETTQNNVVGAERVAFQTAQASDGTFQFHLLAGNGQVLLTSRGYADAVSAGAGMDALMKNGNDPHYYDAITTKDGQFTFDVRNAETNEVIATSDTYASKASADRGAATVRALIRIEQQFRMEAAARGDAPAK